MALRWGLTQGAYEKYAYIFERNLPAKISVKSPISEASYIRDVIRYAHENSLKGATWYGKVKVSAYDQDTIIISQRGHDDLTKYPQHTVFDLLTMQELGHLPSPYTCIIFDSVDAVVAVFKELGYEIIPIDNRTITILKVNSDEV